MHCWNNNAQKRLDLLGGDAQVQSWLEQHKLGAIFRICSDYGNQKDFFSLQVDVEKSLSCLELKKKENETHNELKYKIKNTKTRLVKKKTMKEQN